jgi:hypothetical protein
MFFAERDLNFVKMLTTFEMTTILQAYDCDLGGYLLKRRSTKIIRSEGILLMTSLCLQYNHI